MTTTDNPVDIEALRLAIIDDALAMAEAIDPATGGHVIEFDPATYFCSHKSALSAFVTRWKEGGSGSCRACALGSLLLATVHRRPDLGEVSGWLSFDVQWALCHIFPERVILQMEVAYMCDAGREGHYARSFLRHNWRLSDDVMDEATECFRVFPVAVPPSVRGKVLLRMLRESKGEELDLESWAKHITARDREVIGGL